MRPAAPAFANDPRPSSYCPAKFTRGTARADCSSGLRDLATERLDGDRLGPSAAATAGVQSVDRTHTFGGQLEVQHRDVPGDTAGPGALWTARASALPT